MGNPDTQSPIDYALVVDPEIQFIHLPKTAPLPFSFRPPIVVRTAAEAIRHLTDPQMNFGAICLNTFLSFPGAISIIRMAHETRPGIPIFILQNSPGDHEMPSFAENELHRLGLQGIIQKSAKNPDLFSGIQPLPLAALGNDLSLMEPPDFLLPATLREFLPVPIQNFFFNAKVYFDVFTLNAENHYVKALDAGATFSTDHLEHYLRSNVRQFFFKREHYRRCLDHCRVLERTFLKSNQVASGVKISQTLTLARDALKTLYVDRPLTELELESVLEFNHALHLLVEQLDLTQKHEVDEIFRHVKAYEHSVGTAFVAALLTPALGITGEQSVEDVGVAAFLHDIGLHRLLLKLKVEDPEHIEQHELKLYTEHPQISADILREAPGVREAAIEAILQHHERDGGQGFPKKLSGAQISPIAKIIGISDEFVRLAHALPDCTSADIIRRMKASAIIEFSEPVALALCQIFDPADDTSEETA